MLFFSKDHIHCVLILSFASLPFFLPLASIASNETQITNNGNGATEDPPSAKKTRRCQRQGVIKEPVAGGKADKDKTEDKQGQLPVVDQEGQ